VTSPIKFTRGSGGKFTGSIGGVPVPPSMAALFSRLGAEAGGSLSFNGKRGTGYGAAGGDARVRMLQAALNAAGFGDASGHSLTVDGKLGPLTTAAIKAAQKKLGVPANGTVTPKLLAQIMAMPKGKVLPGRPAAKKKTARQLMSRKPVMKAAAKSKAPAHKPAAPAPAVGRRVASRGYAI
jgi:peptidoglycan hydrolase-like protein with peptidoglycan-binding domain